MSKVHSENFPSQDKRNYEKKKQAVSFAGNKGQSSSRLRSEEGTKTKKPKIRIVSKKPTNAAPDEDYLTRGVTEYTDKDRAAAVVQEPFMSTFVKKRKTSLERVMDLSTKPHEDDEFLAGMLLTEAIFQMKSKKYSTALASLGKAVELEEEHRGVWAARSQCNFKLGQVKEALEDAKESIRYGEKYPEGIYRHAEALYNLAQFEKALIHYQRGMAIWNNEGFRSGIKNSVEAINRSIGDHSVTKIKDLGLILRKIALLKAANNWKGGDCPTGPAINQMGYFSSQEKCTEKPDLASRIRGRWVDRDTLGQLVVDKDFLTSFLRRPVIKGKSDLSQELRAYAKDALRYLDECAEFWRQRNPIYARTPGLNLDNTVVRQLDQKLKKNLSRKSAACKETDVSIPKIVVPAAAVPVATVNVPVWQALAKNVKSDNDNTALNKLKVAVAFKFV